jgi:hypothetical protein
MFLRISTCETVLQMDQNGSNFTDEAIPSAEAKKKKKSFTVEIEPWQMEPDGSKK